VEIRGVFTTGQELFDPLFHLGGRLVGKGDRKDVPGGDPLFSNQVDDTVDNDAGFPEPAPARMSRGPSPWRTASRCRGLSDCRRFIAVPCLVMLESPCYSMTGPGSQFFLSPDLPIASGERLSFRCNLC
jgi:hypothetical protein